MIFYKIYNLDVRGKFYAFSYACTHKYIYLKCDDDDDDDDKRSEFVCANNAIFGFGKCFMPTSLQCSFASCAYA